MTAVRIRIAAANGRKYLEERIRKAAAELENKA